MENIFLQAKKVDLFHYLDSIGIKPVRKNSRKAYYLSPKRTEGNPSFEVDLAKNTWTDRGEPGAFGDPTDFVEWLEGCSKKEAVEIILGKESIPQYHKPPLQEIEEKLIEVTEIRDEVKEPYLVDYLELQRKIPIEVANKYCKEVMFQFSTSRYASHYGIAVENDKGGWNIKNSWFKGSTKPAGVSTVKSTDGVEISIWEGMMDWLSYVVLFGEPDHTCIITNGLVFIPMIVDALVGYDAVHVWLDQDGPADDMVDYLLDHNAQVIDERGFYGSHKDLNEYLQVNYDI